MSVHSQKLRMAWEEAKVNGTWGIQWGHWKSLSRSWLMATPELSGLKV